MQEDVWIKHEQRQVMTAHGFDWKIYSFADFFCPQQIHWLPSGNSIWTLHHCSLFIIQLPIYSEISPISSSELGWSCPFAPNFSNIRHAKRHAKAAFSGHVLQPLLRHPPVANASNTGAQGDEICPEPSLGDGFQRWIYWVKNSVFRDVDIGFNGC